MPRIAGFDIPDNKSIGISLTYIYGIGRYRAKQVLKEAGIDDKVKASTLTEDEVSKLAQVIDRNCIVGGELRRQVSQNIARLRDITCYRGLRHRKMENLI